MDQARARLKAGATMSRAALRGIQSQKKKGALAWEREPRKTHSVSRSFFDRGVGSSILASLSEAGGNDRHRSWSKPLPPCSKTREDRHPKCVHARSLCRLITTPYRIPLVKFPLFMFTFQRLASPGSLSAKLGNPDSGGWNPSSGINPVYPWKGSSCDSSKKVSPRIKMKTSNTRIS